MNTILMIRFILFTYRFASRIKFNFTGHGTIITHCAFSYICYHHICNYWIRAILWDFAYHLLG